MSHYNIKNASEILKIIHCNWNEEWLKEIYGFSLSNHFITKYGEKINYANIFKFVVSLDDGGKLENYLNKNY